jgi:hypothetical protein
MHSLGCSRDADDQCVHPVARTAYGSSNDAGCCGRLMCTALALGAAVMPMTDVSRHSFDCSCAKHGCCVHLACTALGAAVMPMTHVCIQLHARPMAAVMMLAAACI